MGQHSARQKRQPGQTTRRAPTREQYDKVLIVCEGKKTEPNYFLGLRNWHKISSVNVTVSGDCGSAPTSVVQHGIDLYRAAQGQGEPYDRVYCVFDRDSYHLPSQNKVYQQALDQIQRAMPTSVFFAANSVPSFEYWLLLHFCETRQTFVAQGKASVGDMVEKELRKYWIGYEKAMPKSYDQLKKLAPQGAAQALIRAARGLNAAQAVGDDNPSTKVHELVGYLIKIKDLKNS